MNVVNNVMTNVVRKGAKKRREKTSLQGAQSKANGGRARSASGRGASKAIVHRPSSIVHRPSCNGRPQRPGAARPGRGVSAARLRGLAQRPHLKNDGKKTQQDGKRGSKGVLVREVCVERIASAPTEKEEEDMPPRVMSREIAPHSHHQGRLGLDVQCSDSYTRFDEEKRARKTKGKRRPITEDLKKKKKKKI